MSDFYRISKIVKAEKSLEEIAQNPKEAFDYALKLNFKNVPEIILQGISQNSALSWEYAKALNFKNLPETLGIFRNKKNF